MNKLQAITVTEKTGAELFYSKGIPLDISLLEFWRWSSSDLVGNALRGMLAEFIVASSVDCNSGTRLEWNAVDIETKDGTKIEVKSSAYIQSWEQNEVSTIRFGIQPSKGWYANSNTYAEQKIRQSDVYVFCVLAHKDKTTINPLNLDQWEFYIIATEKIDRLAGNQQSISLSSLKKLEPVEVKYEGISEAVEKALIVNHTSAFQKDL